MREEALALLLGYLEAGALADIKTLKVETTFQLRLGNGTQIQTRVDRIDAAESHQLHIIDYKTGRHQIYETDLSKEMPAVVQLLAVTEASEEPVERVSWVYLRSGETINWWPEAEDVEFAAERLKKVLRRMHVDQEFPPNAGPYCAGCPFRSLCPEGRSERSEDELPMAA
jgi:putative RecB family exonuclease